VNNHKTILLCDDDSIDIKLFKKYLAPEKNLQFTFLEASNPNELYKLLSDRTLKIDVIFLDYYLGLESGLDILKAIRKDNNAPVIVLTGSGDEEIAVDCMKEGAMDYIPKATLPAVDIPKIIQQAIDKWIIERERNQLLGIAAHELRSPVGVILSYTDILKTTDAMENDERNEIYEIIYEQSHHVLNIINELLDITRIDQGIIVLKKRNTNLISLIKKKVKDHQLLAEKKKINIIFNINYEGLEIILDPDRIEEVLANFIDNAVKYSQQNTRVEISVIEKEDTVEINIKDQGQGIKGNELKYLFELFSSRKISTLPTGEESRTGLGLAICKKVIDAHNGEILVNSEFGKGTIFTIVLPKK
jgi:signal transduction histidine kinase